ncbi:hypothetical protein LEP1GSC115_0382, partial [Leptospira interrogans serovar Australis str. 200703203]
SYQMRSYPLLGLIYSKLIRAFFCYFENLISSSFLFSI